MNKYVKIQIFRILSHIFFDWQPLQKFQSYQILIVWIFFKSMELLFFVYYKHKISIILKLLK